ncbi:hypothetical protein OROMI_004629 [Orobanche minor]
MVAYGALVSVMQIIDQLHRHPHPPISLRKEHVEPLAANVTFLQEFLEGYNPHRSYTSEADPLESRVAEAAYAAEDVIESYIVDHIRARNTDDDGGNISSSEFYQGLEKLIQEMDLIKMETVEKNMEGVQIIKKQSSFRSASSTSQEVSKMVGLDDVLVEMLDKITGGGVDRQIIPIVGMGRLGKTTLARNIYANPLVKEHFDICAWSTISQVHNARKILTEILGQVDKEIEKDLSEGELGERLYKYLIGRRYLIVMDDMWSIEAWDKVRSFFPDNEIGSRVVVTTRLSNLASMFNYSNGLDMKFMDEATSWKLFSKTVFGDEFCPFELEDIGKKIVEGCRGLPLSIAVVGKFLSKSEATRENWVHDLLRDLCLREGEKDKFLCDRKISQGMTSSPRRIKNWPKEENSSSTVPIESVEAAIAQSLVRSLRGKFAEETLALPSYRLLRVCFVEEGGSDEYYEKILIRLLNLRFLAAEQHPLLKIPCYLWNLQTLILFDVEKHWDLEICKMPLLRHVMTIDSRKLCLPDPPPPDDEVVVLENLHTLDAVRNLKYGLDPTSVQELCFPYSLKQLVLQRTYLLWEEMATKIGWLPLLQVLKLEDGSFIGSEWETVEGQFSSLKYLKINYCSDLECWTTDNTHFPRLEHLVIRLLTKLSEIPSTIGDIPTLRSIEVVDCCDSTDESAQRIREEHDEYGNEVL